MICDLDNYPPPPRGDILWYHRCSVVFRRWYRLWEHDSSYRHPYAWPNTGQKGTGGSQTCQDNYTYEKTRSFTQLYEQDWLMALKTRQEAQAERDHERTEHGCVGAEQDSSGSGPQDTGSVIESSAN